MKLSLAGKKATVIGLGRSGRSAAGLLKRLGAEVFVSENGPLSREAADWLEREEIMYEAGGHTDRAFRADLVIASPGVRPDSRIFREARSKGIEVWGEIELAWRASPARIIAVTGTNGKSTTTSMIGHVLNRCGKKCLVGGNLAPGRPLCDLAGEAGPDDLIAAEVSSFQLETVSGFHPAVAVVTNITPDHLDRHPNMETYARAKARILENQSEEDTAVLNADDPNVARYCRPAAKALGFSLKGRVKRGAWSDGQSLFLSIDENDRLIMPAAALKIPGRHNLENALAAAAACSALDCRPEDMGQALASFAGVPHRMEEVATANGISFINNSMCTNPAAGAASLRAVEGRVAVIAGGREKGLDMGPYLEAIAARAGAAVLIGESRSMMESGLRKLGFAEICLADSLEQAVSKAAELAGAGGTVLFSPGCSSFDMFRDFEERGRAFRRAVESISKT
jgi:UDP-N-acetylmuramoylalanine--D-glutamate ligase